MPWRTYECTNESCNNFGLKDYEQSIKENDYTECPICKCKILRKYKVIDYSFNCSGAYGKSSK
jgi:predicted nucleic acid-binding Zn ribbon protein